MYVRDYRKVKTESCYKIRKIIVDVFEICYYRRMLKTYRGDKFRKESFKTICIENGKI